MKKTLSFLLASLIMPLAWADSPIILHNNNPKQVQLDYSANGHSYSLIAGGGNSVKSMDTYAKYAVTHLSIGKQAQPIEECEGLVLNQYYQNLVIFIQFIDREHIHCKAQGQLA